MAKRWNLALAAAAMATAGCAGPRWPAARAVGDPAFVSQGGTVGSVDVLPVDLQVWTLPDSTRDPEELSGALESSVSGMVAAQLASRGYQVTSQMGWDGRYVAPDGVVQEAMSEEAVAETASSLSGYGEAQRQVHDGMLVPFLPARLGTRTGAEATLYVGGWAFAGKDHQPSKAWKVAKVVLIVAVVAVVVVAAIAGAKHGGGGALGNVASGVGHAAGGAVKVAGRLVAGVARAGMRTTVAVLRSGSAPDMVQAAVDVADAMGRSQTHLVYYDHRPDYYSEGGPHSGRSAMLLQMTLIDNRTGRVLWHSQQRFPARPEKSADVERAVGTLLAALPSAR